ncbi:MAG TPA: magnesium/cobalt transporter CorA [Rubricoccaceae bacterium]|nr:magnesium/cobalt transporter CorA [Rubricoccaceae bacterium]
MLGLLGRRRRAALAVLFSPERRPRLVERRSHRMGLPPGTLVRPAEKPAKPACIHALRYDAAHVEEVPSCAMEDLRRLADGAGVTWIDLDNVRDVDAVERLGKAFNVHPLALEDVTNTVQRPKLEIYGGQLFCVVKMVNPAPPDTPQGVSGHRIEQVSLVAGPGYVLSFLEDEGDVFDRIRDRIRRGAGRIRREGADYLLYALLDVVIDHYFVTLERIGDITEHFETEVAVNPTPQLQRQIAALRRDVVVLRRALWPLREEIAGLLREDTPLITDTTRLYLRDAYDHLVQAVDVLESLRDVLGGLMDLYLSSLSHRTNEVMKVLTVISAVFIPLTFIAGVYGMNFADIPGVATRADFYRMIGVLTALGLATLFYFRRRGWI